MPISNSRRQRIGNRSPASLLAKFGLGAKQVLRYRAKKTTLLRLTTRLQSSPFRVLSGAIELGSPDPGYTPRVSTPRQPRIIRNWGDQRVIVGGDRIVVRAGDLEATLEEVHAVAAELAAPLRIKPRIVDAAVVLLLDSRYEEQSGCRNLAFFNPPNEIYLPDVFLVESGVARLPQQWKRTSGKKALARATARLWLEEILHGASGGIEPGKFYPFAHRTVSFSEWLYSLSEAEIQRLPLPADRMKKTSWKQQLIEEMWEVDVVAWFEEQGVWMPPQQYAKYPVIIAYKLWRETALN